MNRAGVDTGLFFPKKNFEVMNGLRGVAAMAVVLLHSFSGQMAPNGQLAVDLFFLLSGFVIAYSYHERLLSGMTSREFISRRLIRLYPTAFVGALGGIFVALIHNHTNPGGAYPIFAIAISGALSLLVLPYLGHAIGTNVFSFDPPLWSLFFELAANFVYRACVKSLSNTVLVSVVLIGLMAVVLGGQLGGESKYNLLLGIPRVACGFFGGVLLYKLWRRGLIPEINGNFFVLSAVVFFIFCMPWMISGWAFLPIYTIFVAIMVCAAGAAPSRFDKYCALLGRISYPLYVLHWLTLYMFTWVGGKIGFTGSNYAYTATAHWLAAPVIAYVFAVYYEEPARALLGELWKRQTVVAAAGRV